MRKTGLQVAGCLHKGGMDADKSPQSQTDTHVEFVVRMEPVALTSFGSCSITRVFHH